MPYYASARDLHQVARGGRARAVRAGKAYVDVGTLHGYREAITLLGSDEAHTLPRTALR